MSVDERRKAKRVTFFCEADLEGIDVARTQVRLGDLSTEGAFIDARTVLPPGTLAKLRFSIGEHEISVMAEVRYSMASIGMGIRFVELKPEDRLAIEKLVTQHA